MSGISGPFTVQGGTVKGLDTADGKFFVVTSVALIIAAIVMRSATSDRMRISSILFVLFSSLFVLFLAVADLFTLSSELKEEMLRTFTGGEEVPGAIVTVRLGPGLFLVIVGAVLGFLSGTAGMVLQTPKRKTS